MWSQPSPRPSRRFNAPWKVFWVALALRLFFLTIGKLYVFTTIVDHHAFGSEAGHIARALLTGRGYSDPFWWGQSGPTAWLAPGYPLLLAAAFKLFGIYSNTAAWVVLAIQCVFNAAVTRWLWEIGARCFGETTARWTAWTWALCPWAMLYAVIFPWETSISTALFCWVWVQTLRLGAVGGEGGPTWGRWAGWGTTWGAVAMFNPSLLLFLPCAGIWLLLQDGGLAGELRSRLAGAGLAAAIFCAIMAPWWIRNERVFHKFIPARGNLGVEACNGNCYGIEGVIGQWDHPDFSPHEMALYRQLGEVRYDARRKQELVSAVKARPLEFVEMTLLRIDFYWFGVEHPRSKPLLDWFVTALFSFLSLGGIWGAWTAWRRKLPGGALFALALLIMPSLYYVVETQERYRHPLEPLLYVLSIYSIVAAEKSWRVRWFARRRPEVDAGHVARANSRQETLPASQAA